MGVRGLAAFGADVMAVLLFVVLGRGSHREGSAVLGTVSVAWPFLVGVGVGWLVVAALGRRRPLPVTGPRAGVAVAASTIVVGMVLRRLSDGGGTPVSFVIVASCFVVAFLLGWRVARAAVVRRRQAATGP